MEPVDLLTVGLTVLDLLGRGVEEIPPNGSVALIEQIRMTPAGTAAAPAMIGARLGLTTRLLGAVGQDEMGDFVVAGLARRGVDTTLMQRTDALPTSATLLPIRRNGDRPALHAPGASLLVRLDDDLDALLRCRFLHLGGVGTMPAIDGEPARALVAAAQARGITTSCDIIAPNEATVAALVPLLTHLDYFMPTREEACSLSGANNVEDAAAWFLDRGVGVCIFKCGSEGSLIADRDGLKRIPAFAVDVVDTSGCGDSYCAGFVAARARGFELEEACRFASATAALVATGLGSDAGVESFDATLEAMHSLPTAS